MHQIDPQRSDLRPSDHLVAVDVLLRREPDEDEEDEDEDDRRKEDADDEGESDDGYSE